MAALISCHEIVQNTPLMPCVVRLHIVYAMLVVVYSINVLDDYPIPTNCPEFVVPHPIMCPIGGHDHHDIIFLFHSKVTERNIVKLIVQYINGPHTLVGEVKLNILTIGIAGPLPPLLAESGSINSLLFYIHKSLQGT